MQIIQFVCTDEPTANELKARMTTIINLVSRLQYLADDPAYVTEPFTIAGWFSHLTTPGLYWVPWDAVYANLGDIGRALVDEMIVPFMVGQEFNQYPGIVLEIVDVEDLVAAEYAPAPEPVSL